MGKPTPQAPPPRWIIAEIDPERARRLADAADIPPRLAEILLLRGVEEPAEVVRFLRPRLKDLPDPSEMADMAAAAARIADAVEREEVIAVYGDYDVDGVTSAALLHRFFASLGVGVEVFVPDRFADGYGLNADRVRELVEAGARLLITVDCGTAHRAEVALAQDGGCDVIVVDHHKVPPEPAEPMALLNPVRADCPFPFDRLAAVGVAFYLAMAVRRELRERGAFSEGRPEPDLLGLLELVALGTVADVMPLKGLNRILVERGLARMNARPSAGIAALAQVSGIEGRPIGSTDLGFRLGPRINAAGRMTHARSGLELLTQERPGRAEELARTLNRENQSRRDTERGVLKEALGQAEAQVEAGARGLVLFAPGWHLGVVGIVASRVREAFGRPAFVLGAHPTDGRAKGSGRSVPGFDLVEALRSCGAKLDQFGGHAHAAGVSLAADRVEAFARSFDARARELLSLEDLRPRLRIDRFLEAEEIGEELLRLVDRLAPFGAGNPRPVFALRGVRARSWRTMGDGSHLQIRVPAGGGELRAVAFGLAGRAPLLDTPVDLAFQLTENLWRGRRSVELSVKDIRAAG